VPLADWGLIRARGADAVTFLQGQLTNELASAGASQARLAGYCSPKGRLLASFVAWQVTGAEDWLLACSADVLPPTLKRLSMFVMRAQCKLSQADDVALWGLVGPAAQQWLGTDLPAQAWGVSRVKDAQVVRLPDVDGTVRCLWAGPPSRPRPSCPHCPRRSGSCWRCAAAWPASSRPPARPSCPRWSTSSWWAA
jgi:folate-binding Fe-S cluster repair protein YgfZ